MATAQASPRDTAAAPYDVDYTYDPNGNLLTLRRNNDQSGLMHDFDYMYYPIRIN